MSNKIYEIFNPNSKYNERISEHLNQLKQKWIEERDCFVCRNMLDISDDRNSCYLCKYTKNILPEDHTCLLWELGEEYDK